MKILAACLALLVAASLTHAQTAAAPAAPAAPAKPATEAKATPGTKAAPVKPSLKKEEKKEQEPKIPGTVIARANGTFLGLEVVSGNFKLTFYDKKKKPMNVDVTRATARWPNPRSPGDNRTVLNGAGTSLVGAKPVLPPFTFNVYLTLLQGEEAVESYVVAFRG
jgi:hypothetical protein